MGGHSVAAPALSVLFPAALSAPAVARYSADSLEGVLPGPASLLIAPVSGAERVLLGQFERNTPPFDEIPPGSSEAPVFRRCSGGGTLLVGEGRVYMNLRLEAPFALTECDEAKLLNRYVRPLLRALTRIAAPAHYFGRDWIACGASRAPIASISFAHHARTRRSVIESVIAFSEPFAPISPTFLGKAPTMVQRVASTIRNSSEFCALVAESYAAAYGIGLDPMEALPSFPEALPCPTQTHWDAEGPEAIGTIGASVVDGRLELGGAFMASEDAVREFEARVNALPHGASLDDIGADADAVFTAPGVALFGVRSLHSIRDVAFAALGSRARSSRGDRS